MEIFNINMMCGTVSGSIIVGLIIYAIMMKTNVMDDQNVKIIISVIVSIITFLIAMVQNNMCVENFSDSGDMVNGEDDDIGYASDVINKEDILDVNNEEDILDVNNEKDILDIKKKEGILDVNNEEDILDVNNEEDILDINNEEDILDVNNEEDILVINNEEDILDVNNEEDIFDVIGEENDEKYIFNVTDEEDLPGNLPEEILDDKVDILEDGVNGYNGDMTYNFMNNLLGKINNVGSDIIANDTKNVFQNTLNTLFGKKSDDVKKIEPFANMIESAANQETIPEEQIRPIVAKTTPIINYPCKKIPSGKLSVNRPSYKLLSDMSKSDKNKLSFNTLPQLMKKSKLKDIYNQFAHVSTAEFDRRNYFGRARLPLTFDSSFRCK
jgi:hypothetical protein